MGKFRDSLRREVGKNTGKWVSNKVFGDGHSTPHRVRIQREKTKQSKIDAKAQREEIQARREIAELEAESKKSDAVRIKEMEQEGKMLKMSFIIFPFVLLGLAFLGYGDEISAFISKQFKSTSAPSCENIVDCISKNDFQQAKSYLASSDSTKGEDAFMILNAEVSYLLVEEDYHAAYQAAKYLLGVRFADDEALNQIKRDKAFGDLISLIIQDAIINGDSDEAKKYAQIHPDQEKANELIKRVN